MIVRPVVECGLFYVAKVMRQSAAVNRKPSVAEHGLVQTGGGETPTTAGWRK